MAGDVGGAVLPECSLQGVFEVTVFLFESADPVGGGLESAQQRCVGGCSQSPKQSRESASADGRIHRMTAGHLDREGVESRERVGDGGHGGPRVGWVSVTGGSGRAVQSAWLKSDAAGGRIAPW